MFFGLGAVAAIATVIISFNNPRAIFWIMLGTMKVLICSLYVQVSLPNFILWAPDGLFVSLIFTSVFCHLLERYYVFKWEMVFQRFVLISVLFSLADFLNVPLGSVIYENVNTFLYAVCLALIFANSLVKARILNGNQNIKLNALLRRIGCNSKHVNRKHGWAERWV